MIRSKKDYFGMAPFSDLKNVASAALKVMQGKTEKKEVNEEEKSKGPSTVNNALFVGSTAELAKMIKESDLSSSSK